MVRLLRFPLLLKTFLSTQGQQGRHDYPGVTWGAAGAREIREKAEVVFFLQYICLYFVGFFFVFIT